MNIDCPTCKKPLIENKMVWKCLNPKCTHYKKRQFGKTEEE